MRREVCEREETIHAVYPAHAKWIGQVMLEDWILGCACVLTPTLALKVTCHGLYVRLDPSFSNPLPPLPVEKLPTNPQRLMGINLSLTYLQGLTDHSNESLYAKSSVCYGRVQLLKRAKNMTYFSQKWMIYALLCHCKLTWLSSSGGTYKGKS